MSKQNRICSKKKKLDTQNHDIVACRVVNKWRWSNVAATIQALKNWKFALIVMRMIRLLRIRAGVCVFNVFVILVRVWIRKKMNSRQKMSEKIEKKIGTFKTDEQPMYRVDKQSFKNFFFVIHLCLPFFSHCISNRIVMLFNYITNAKNKNKKTGNECRTPN